MSKRAEEAALEAYNDMFHNPEKMSVRSTVSEEEAAQFDYKEPFKAFFLDVFQQGYKQAEKVFQEKVKERMEYLWEKLPDADNDKPTVEELKALGAYMELEMNFDKEN